MREKFDVLQTHSEELAKQFGSTSEQNKKLTELAQNAKANANALQEQVEDLRAAQATAAERAERIDVSRQIRDLAIRVFHSPARANEARKLKDELATFGTSVSLFSYAAYANLNPSVKLTHTAGRKADAERIIKLLGDQLEFDKVSVASSDKADVFIHLYGK